MILRMTNYSLIDHGQNDERLEREQLIMTKMLLLKSQSLFYIIFYKITKINLGYQNLR